MQPQAVTVGSRRVAARRTRHSCDNDREASYKITRLIKRGSRFELFRAAAGGDLGPGCYVVKTPRKNVTRELAIAMLRREATVASSVQHPNLNCVLAAETAEPEPFLIRPFRDGASLRQLLDCSGCFIAAPRALNIIRQIAEALTAMHAAGWLHGQVRPEHLLLSPQGQATLIDLTAARRLESAECDSADLLPRDGRYSAPEIAGRGRRVTAAADTYSLGIVLYEILAGRAPFGGSPPQELVRQHQCDAIPDIRAARPDVSLEVAHLMRLMLAKEPLRRPSDNELVRWLAELEIAALAV